MSEQLELQTAKTAVPPADVRWLEQMLLDAHCWLTAADILRTAEGAGLHDRAVREYASLSDWIISGQKGYKHLEHATAEEIAHASNWLISQGKRMIQRGLRIKRNAHRKLA